jgi:very-short-patch-repair endonuclease
MYLSKTVRNLQRMGDIACERKSQLKKNPTKAEKIVLEYLRSLKIPAKFQQIFYTPKNYFIVDFKIALKPHTFLEIDGKIHDHQKDYDKTREYLISKTRWHKYVFLRITNEQVFSGEFKNILSNHFKRFFNRYEKRKAKCPATPAHILIGTP